MNLELPEKLDFGGGELVELKYLQDVFGISRRTAMLYLRALRIKPLFVGRKVFFSLPTLKRILFVLNKPGGPGFIAPGSTAKNNPRFINNPDYLTKVTDEILEKAANPAIIAEMEACSGRNPNIVSKFLNKPIGRPKKEESK